MNDWLKKQVGKILLVALLLVSFAASAKTIHIIMFNDFHGQVDETATEPGMAKFVAAIKGELKKFPEALVVAGGDNYQGSATSDLTHGEIVSRMLKEIHITASAVGNHEFDWGQNWFKVWQTDGDFNYLAANVIDEKSHKIPKWAKPYKIVNVAGYKIAFIGLSTIDTTVLVFPSVIKGLQFIDAAQAAQPWLDYLIAGKDPQGKPDAIIALTHIPSIPDPKTQQITGKELTNLIDHTQHLDAVLSAHSHEQVVGMVHGVPVLQAGYYGHALGEVALSFDDKTRRLQKVAPSLIDLVSRKEDIRPDPEALVIYQKYENNVAHVLSRVVGRNNIWLAKYPEKTGGASLPQWACEKLRDITKADIVLQQRGFFRANLPAGEITLRTMYQVFSFDDSILLCDLSGEQILKLLNFSLTRELKLQLAYAGINLQLDPTKTKIINAALLDGEPLKKDRYYRVAVNNFLLTGGNYYDFSKAKNVVNTGVLIRDALIKALDS